MDVINALINVTRSVLIAFKDNVFNVKLGMQKMDLYVLIFAEMDTSLKNQNNVTMVTFKIMMGVMELARLKIIGNA